MKWLSAFTVLFALALAVPALASDSDALGGTPSVKAVQSHGWTVITFNGRRGARLFKKLAGRAGHTSCGTVRTDPTSSSGEVSSGETFIAPKHGRKLRLRITSKQADWCEIIVDRKKHHPAAAVVAVALTPTGITFLDERLRAITVDALVNVASLDAKSGRYPTTDQIVAKTHGAIVALANPGDPLAPGQYGFYSDGAQHVEAVAVTPTGKRLFEDVNGDTVSTNLGDYISSLNFD